MSNITEKQLATLRLARTKGIGTVTFLQLLSVCDNDPILAVERLPELWLQHRKSNQKLADEAAVQAEMQQLYAAGGQLICHGDLGYPSALAQTPDAPIVLSVLGDASWLNRAQVAIVGNRNASAAGTKFTEAIAQDFAAAGFAVTSGLARGIDAAAHRGALAAGGGTVAVVAGGVDHIYPPENKDLREQIMASGCVVSEHPWGETPTARHFPRRNRIIAGLSLATVVCEASRNSGTLITTSYAGEYGRDVFAVPGSPADPRAAGPNHLLKQGAQALTEAADLLESIKPSMSVKTQPAVRYTREQQDLFAPENEAEPKLNGADFSEETSAPQTGLLSHLSSAPISVDELIRRAKMPETAAIVELTTLELTGQIMRTAAGEIKLA